MGKERGCYDRINVLFLALSPPPCSPPQSLGYPVTTCGKLAFYKYLNGMCNISHDICPLAKVGLLNEANATHCLFPAEVKCDGCESQISFAFGAINHTVYSAM